MKTNPSIFNPEWQYTKSSHMTQDYLLTKFREIQKQLKKELKKNANVQPIRKAK